jgi:hypothetical protein
MTEEFQIEYERYTNLAFQRRGVIINEVVLLERVIDEILAYYFCGSNPKKQELMELIICTNRMIFENKIQVLKVLLEKHKPDFLKNNPTIINDITQKIIVERNIFAHYWLVTSAELSTFVKAKQTVFIKFKNTTEYIYYDNNSFAAICEVIAKAIKIFIAFQQANFGD